MKPPAQMSRTAILVEAALMVALAFVLSMIKLYQLPWGGTISCFSTLPIILMSLRHSWRWGMATAAVYGIAQMFQGMDSVMAAKTLWAMVLCAALDYLLAYACVGLTGPIARRLGGRTGAIAAAITLTGLMRLVCSFFSGLLIWHAYAWPGWPVWAYSLAYNASWCVPDVAIVLVVALLLSRVKALGMGAPAPARAAAQR
ncbi:MAG: energy-coupled thiamine transporter ThiT [Oscillospiraceae bacterium]